MAKKALGKGLGALIKPAPAPSAASGPREEVAYLKVSDIVASPHNPRKEFAQTEISELAASILEHGIIQPLIVRPLGNTYELIAGERRWRASQSVNLAVVPAIVREASDREVVEMALIENLQRQDLNPIEEAQGYHQLAREFDLTQEEIAKRVGKSRASVANALRLLDFSPEVRALIADRQLTVGHAKVILGVKNEEQQGALVEQVIRQKWTVRQTEQAVQKGPQPDKDGPSESTVATTEQTALQSLESDLRTHFASTVTLKSNAAGTKGKIEIPFHGPEDLARLASLLGLPRGR